MDNTLFDQYLPYLTLAVAVAAKVNPKSLTARVDDYSIL